jgi:threonyl-tRNA synthetase
MKNEEKNLEALRHSLSHVLMQALENLFKAVPGVGPAIENGFYHDFDAEHKMSEGDLIRVEEEMRKIIKENLEIEKSEMTADKAIELLREKKYVYTAELARDLKKEGEGTLTFFRQGDFINMCKGPHLAATGKINPDAFKLTKLAGAYWKGDEKNKMLQRIYGVAFGTKTELEEYLKIQEEAEKRDHRKLGKELDLFSFHDVGPGFPFFKPKGMIIWNELLDFWREIHRQAGYDEIKTPIMLSRKLWEISGHWMNYRENMYESKIDDMEFAIKPMNCPGGMLIYKEGIHSYRDLPLRMGEVGLVHRHELSGVLSGLFRVRQFHQDDAHIYMRPDQIKEEILGVLSLAEKIYSIFGLTYHLELSTRPEKSIGTDEAWETATAGLKEALDAIGREYKINEGDGAFYGPKIDVHIKDAIGRTWQCGTIQLDMNMPERFDLHYIDSDGGEKRPVMIHRVIYGSVERFFGILIEHFAGAWPVWLSPVQVKIISVGEKHTEFSLKLKKELEEEGIRAETDTGDETVGNKIRKASGEKIPYVIVIGDKEMGGEKLAVRVRGIKELKLMVKEELIGEVKKKIEKRLME